MSCTKENCNQTVYTSGGILAACVLKKKKESLSWRSLVAGTVTCGLKPKQD